MKNSLGCGKLTPCSKFMSPELKDWPEALSRVIAEKAGATPEKEEKLKRELDEAYKRGDVELVASLAGELSPIKKLREDLGEISNELAEFIERNELSNIDIPYSALVAKQAQETPTEESKEKQKESPERRGRRKPDKYVDDAPAVVANAIIETTGTMAEKTPGIKSFRHKSFDSISRSILQKDFKRNRKALKDARLYIYTITNDLAKGIPVYAKQTKVKTMSELTDRLLPSVKNTSWKSFYEKVGQKFGRLSPEFFAEKVILRLQSDEEVTSELKKLLKKEEKLSRISPRDITPADELILLNALTSKGVLDSLEGFLGFETLSEILKTENGVNIDNAWTKFDSNRQRMAAKRNNEALPETQRQESMLKIRKIIEQLAKDRRGWHKLNKEYEGFTFLCRVCGATGNDFSKVQKLVDILFPRREYQIDARAGFLLEIGKDKQI